MMNNIQHLFSRAGSKLNWIFIYEVAVFALIITGVLPRAVVPYFAVSLAIYVLFAPLEDATVFFVRSIPFFLAIPITQTFDNFNVWRILSVIIFLKWLWQIPDLKQKIKDNHRSKLSFVLHILVIFSLLSIIPSPDKMLAVKRILYFLNLSLIGFVVMDLAQKGGFTRRLIKNISIPTIAVALVGFIQLVLTYFVDIYQFMRIWGEGIQCNQFGSQWCYIAVHVGNTWFAYYGEQLSLRMFSLFPDSHSFPQFLLLGLPAIFAVALAGLVKEHHVSLKKMITTRPPLSIVWVPVIFLASILSGTRGIWAASLGAVLFAGFFIYKAKGRRKILIYLTSYTALFFILFAVALPIFESPQFLLSKPDALLLEKRIESILDFGETSNSQRIAIWKATLGSIKRHPFLGVGIGNFPIVLNQKLVLAKAGSSAHNIYLHIAAEIGIPASIFVVWFLWILIQKIYQNFVASKDWMIVVYNGAALIFIPWILVYCLTDVALFDERAFLFFVTTVSLILATKNPEHRDIKA